MREPSQRDRHHGDTEQESGPSGSKSVRGIHRVLEIEAGSLLYLPEAPHRKTLPPSSRFDGKWLGPSVPPIRRSGTGFWQVDGHTAMVNQARKSRRAVLLGVDQLTEAEDRSRRSMLRLIFYVYTAVLVLGMVLFSKEWWEILIVGWIVGFGLLVWYFTYIRRARRQRGETNH